MSDVEPQIGGWTIDKHVPVALIFVLLIQAGGFGYWAATIESRAVQNTARIAEIQEERAQARQSGNFEHRVTRLEVTLSNIQTTLEDIKRALERDRIGTP